MSNACKVVKDKNVDGFYFTHEKDILENASMII